MRLFNEIYGLYYSITAMALGRGRLTDRDVCDLITEHGTEETILGLAPKLLPAKSKDSPSDDWGFFRRENDLSLTSIFRHKPKQLLTGLERRWLKSKLSDRRIRLFLSDETLEALGRELADVKPLYPEGFFHCFDRFSDGDDMSDPEYRKIFRVCLQAYKQKKPLYVRYLSGKGNIISGMVLPLKLEYSFKNDKFRMYCRAIGDRKKHGGFEQMIINLGRLETARFADKNDGIMRRGGRRDQKQEAAAVIRVTTERNAVERFMLEFAAYPKTTVRDPSTGECTVDLHYNIGDETELLIRLLGFGPTIEIVSPPALRAQAAERIFRQYDRFFADEKP